MAKRAGWYPDPWGGDGKRWWDGRQWTEHSHDAQGVPAPIGPAVSMGRPMISAQPVRPWWQSWWFIALMLFWCCWPLGLVLIWMRESTPASIKVAATLAAVVTNLMLALLLLHFGLVNPRT